MKKCGIIDKQVNSDKKCMIFAGNFLAPTIISWIYDPRIHYWYAGDWWQRLAVDGRANSQAVMRVFLFPINPPTHFTLTVSIKCQFWKFLFLNFV